MSSQSSANQQVFGAFFKLFEWAYDIRFRPDQKEEIENEILGGWSNTDDSDKELLSYILELHDLAFGRGKSQHQQLKTQAQGFLKDIFSIPEINDRRRILETLHRAIEELHPGVTKVAILPKPTFSSRTPVLITPQPMVSPQVQPAGIFTQPWAGAQNPSTIPSDPADFERIKRKAKEEAQSLELQSHLEKIRAGTIDVILSNMRS